MNMDDLFAMGFCKAAEEHGVDPAQLAKYAQSGKGPHQDAISSLAGLSGHDAGNVARFLIEEDPTGKNDFSRYLLHATNPDIDYSSDLFQTQLDQFVNANLKEMRLRKIKRLLLEYVNGKHDVGEGSAWSDEKIRKGIASPTSGEKLDYMFAKRPWKKKDGVFISAKGTPVFEVDV